jgi:hypothetical protein
LVADGIGVEVAAGLIGLLFLEQAHGMAIPTRTIKVKKIFFILGFLRQKEIIPFLALIQPR